MKGQDSIFMIPFICDNHISWSKDLISQNVNYYNFSWYLVCSKSLLLNGSLSIDPNGLISVFRWRSLFHFQDLGDLEEDEDDDDEEDEEDVPKDEEDAPRDEL